MSNERAVLAHMIENRDEWIRTENRIWDERMGKFPDGESRVRVCEFHIGRIRKWQDEILLMKDVLMMAQDWDK